ncbi:nuclease-related domain-containing protein [Ferrovibrio sp.]|uniref:nuclease-related domain-containing protein n=1 Tax=Ferrovibrio sp. TaxID=1917215 RepID=UPI00311EF1C7
MYEFAIGAFVILIIAWNIFKPRIRGWQGEARVCRQLRWHGIPHMRDVRLIGANGRPYQIDVLAWIGDSFFVIEVKNYSGTIKGWETDQDWTQILGGQRFRFYNPLRQNYGHLMAMRENFPALPFEGLVVFAGSASVAVSHPEVVNMKGFRVGLARPDAKPKATPYLARGWAAIQAAGIDASGRRQRRRERLSGSQGAEPPPTT